MLTREQLEADLRWLEEAPDKAELGDRACRRWPSAVKTALALMDENERLRQRVKDLSPKPYPEDGGW